MNWQTPQELPDLRRVGIIALDIETNDEGLRADRGSAWPWRDGYVAGISVAWRAEGDMRAIYIPLRHPDSDCFGPAQVYRWLADLVASKTRIATLNGVYDWGWLHADGNIAMPPSDRLEEIGALATTVNENLFRYSLDALCGTYGLPGKDEILLREAVETAGFVKGRKKVNAKEHIWRLPARYVGIYAEADAFNTLALYEKLDPILDQEKIRDAYRLEVDLLPMVLEMRARGIRIDQSAAEQARDQLLAKRDAALAEISSQLGTAVSMAEINSSKWKAKAFDANQIDYPRTPKGNPSFAAGKSGWLAKHGHWLPRGIATAAKYDAAGTKFVEGHILNHIVNGRIHAEIHPYRAADGGTRSSRFAYSNPPLQQMPSRDPELGPLIRNVFLPEAGEFWAKPDVAQQEFRLLVHYAVQHKLRGAQEAADAYRNNPDADFHNVVAEMTGLDRSAAKATNFAKIYGAGVRKMAEMIGKPLDEVQAIVSQYDAKLQFVAKLSAVYQEKASRTGFTVLYDGARRHWNLWEVPRLYAKGAGPCGIEEARRRIADPEHPWYGQRLSRANVYTALNALVQGTAARHTKLWMRTVFREGIVPLLQMHDCLDCSVRTREQAELVAQLGCDAVSLEVPMRVDLKFGRSWGDALHSWEELTGDSAPIKSVPTATVVAIKTVSAVPPKPAIVVSPGPAIVIPLPPRAPAAIAAAATSPPASPPPIDAADIQTEIDLADLVDCPECPVPANRMVLCPFHDETKPSMRIYRDHYYCFGCGEYGDHSDWLTRVEGIEYAEAQEILDNWSGPVVSRSREQDDAKRTANALKLWDRAWAIAGTLAARYLTEVRGIDLSVLPKDISERGLRFHPDCPFGPGTRHPCLIALMRDPITGRPTGIHRIALTADAQKIDRMMLGPAGVVQLWSADNQLVIGEGLETVLAAATKLPYRGEPLRPAWAALSKGNLGRFPVIDGVGRLIVLADNDIFGIGQAAADECKQRWLKAGRRCARLMPDRPGTDFNDIVLEGRERAS